MALRRLYLTFFMGTLLLSVEKMDLVKFCALWQTIILCFDNMWFSFSDKPSVYGNAIYLW